MRNLNRITNYYSKQAAIGDLVYVLSQVKNYNPPKPPFTSVDEVGHTKIDKYTQVLINWAGTNNISIQLPEGWQEAKGK